MESTSPTHKMIMKKKSNPKYVGALLEFDFVAFFSSNFGATILRINSSN
jgi:hypothetical protein